MGVRAGVGASKEKNSFQAGVRATKGALSRMGKGRPDFVLVFSTESFEQEKLLRGIRSITGDVPLMGCCGAGVITKGGLSSNSVAVMTVRSNNVDFIPSLGKGISRGGRAAGEKAAERALLKYQKTSAKKARAGRVKSFLMLPDGLTGNITDVVEGAYKVLGAGYHIFGGGTGDNVKFIKTFQFIDDKVYRDALASVLLISEDPVGIGIQHGWTAVGEPKIVTKAKGNVVFKINGKPAMITCLDFFKEAKGVDIEDFGELALTHPLGISNIYGEYLIRDPLRAGPDGSIFCVAEVPENSVVRLMKGNKRSLITAARRAAKEAVKGLGGREPGLAIIFDCVSRLLFLGKSSNQELEAIRNIVGERVPLIGFSTFGEIGAMKGPPVFHNKTVVVYVMAK